MSVLLFLALLWCAHLLPAQTTVPQWRLHTPLPVALTGHATVLLHNGDLLIAGGLDADGRATAASFIYSAATGAIAPTINTLADARACHALVVVPVAGSSRVFAVGGYAGTSGDYRSLASVEVLEFDNALNNWRWRRIGSLSEARGDCAAAWDGGDVVVVGGGRVQNGGALHSGVPTTTTDRIAVQTLQVTPIGAMTTARAEHALVRILDAQNRRQIATAGGETTRPTTSTELLPAGAAVWDPLANPPVVYRSAAAAVGDIAGIARVFGGFSDAGVPLNTCEWYDVKSGWRAAPRMQTARARARVSLIAGPVDTVGAYLIAGGIGTAGVLGETEIFSLPDNTTPAGQWLPFPALNRRGAERTVAVAGSNLPVVAGGQDGSAMQQTEIFQPLRANDLAFGQEEVGRRSDSLAVEIRNEWLLPVQVHTFRFAQGAEFTLSGDTSARSIAPGGRRIVQVRFRPNAAGERSDLLLFDVGPITDTVRLRGTGVESEIAVVSGSVSFDSVFVRTTERKCFTAIRNRGTDTTVVDSVVVTPADVYRVVSPVGRVAVPPGDSLTVCVEFSPRERGAAVSSVTVHIAARTFPVGIAGTGIRRYAVASSMPDCDTLAIAPGDSTTRFVTLFNPGDRTVTVTSAVITAGADGLFALADPDVLPLDLAPGATVAVEIAFRPQREATERATVEFINNGDTLTRSELCFVLRSRFLAASVGEVDFGTLCAGDSAVASFLLENPGRFESITIDDVALGTAGAFAVVAASDTTLLPREYMQVRVLCMPTASGELRDTITAVGSFGAVEVPVRARVVPTLSFVPSAPEAAPGMTVVVPVEVTGDAVQMQAIDLTFGYSRTMLYPRRVVSLAGAPALDAALSALSLEAPGIARLRVVWQTSVAGPGPVFGVECEVLRGDNDRAMLAIDGAGGTGFCVQQTNVTVPIDGPCGGQSGFIRTDGASFVSALPNPAVDVVQVLVHPSRPGRLTLHLVNTLGEPVAVRELGWYDSGSVQTEVPVGTLPAGLYFLRAGIDAEIIDVQPVMILR